MSQGQVFVLQLVLVVLFGLGAVAALVLQAQGASVQEARNRSLTGAETFANAPGTLAAIKSADPTASLQPRAEAARKTSGVDYIVVFSPAGIRWTHPNPQLIGKHVLGSYDQALGGHAQTGTFTTPLGLTVDSTVPIFDTNGKVVGATRCGVNRRTQSWPTSGSSRATAATGCSSLARPRRYTTRRWTRSRRRSGFSIRSSSTKYESRCSSSASCSHTPLSLWVRW
ncbi:hypothetical protein ACWEP4_30590 [Streptomyces sp. NPDC004227]